MTRFKRFDRNQLELKPISDRQNLLTVQDVLEIDPLRSALVWSYQSAGFFSARRGSCLLYTSDAADERG